MGKVNWQGDVAALLAVMALVVGCDKREVKQAPAPQPSAAVPIVTTVPAREPAVEEAKRATAPAVPATERREERERRVLRESLAWHEQEMASLATNITGVMREMYEIEVAARASDARVAAAYADMMRAREAYEQLIAALPRMQKLQQERERLQAAYSRLNEQRRELTMEMDRRGNNP